MSVDFNKKTIVLVVHGVQLGSDDDQSQDESIRSLIEERRGDTALNYDVDLYRYENIADKALGKYKKLSALILKSPVGTKLVQAGIDIIGDVVISLANNSTANVIRKGLKEQILTYYGAGNPVVIVAHSLGSVYAFDVINQLIDESVYFNRDDQSTWPVQSLLTIGSPLSLPMFKISGRDTAKNLGAGRFRFRWVNYYDVTDPVVSGSLFGDPITDFSIAESYQQPTDEHGWFARDFPVDTGKQWFLAHTEYWSVAAVGDGLLNTIV